MAEAVKLDRKIICVLEAKSRMSSKVLSLLLLEILRKGNILVHTFFMSNTLSDFINLVLA